MQFSWSAHRWHSSPHLSSDPHHWSVLTSGSSGFFSVPESYFIPSPCDSVLEQCALQGCTGSFQKRSGHSLSLTALRAFSGTIVMDSESGWFIDHSPQLSCEYSNSYQSPPEVTFPQSLSLPAYKWFLFCATGDFETRANWIFKAGLHNKRISEVFLRWTRPSRTLSIHHRGRGGSSWTAVVFETKRGEKQRAPDRWA